MKTIFKLKSLTSLALVLLVLAGCSNGASNATVDEDGSFEIVIARGNDISGLDPGFLKESAQVVDNIFDRLIMRDKDMKLVPGLATSWEAIDDTTWEFKLREGVTFTNGEVFNADAVKYSIDRVLDPANNAPTLSYIKTIDHLEVVDDYTIRVITKTTDPLIPARFCRYPTEIVPPLYTEEVGQQGFSESPIGTGPYKFVEWVKDDHVTLEINKDYWGDAPEVTKVTWRSIPESSTRISALLNGEVDIAAAVPPEEIERVESSENARISTVERGGNTVYVGLKTEEAPFDNVLVRQALNYAIDVDSIVKNVLAGTAVATNSLIGPNDFGYDGEPEGYGYDPEKAKALLAEAGYADGFTTTLDTVNWYIRNTDVAQAIADQLSKVGITIKVNNIENSVYRTSVPAKKQSPMYVLGWSSTNTLDADAAIYSVLHSSDPYSTYNSPTVDEMLDKARSSTDAAEREQLYSDIQKTVIEDAPRIFLYQENKFFGVSERVEWEGRVDDAIPVATMTAKAAK